MLQTYYEKQAPAQNCEAFRAKGFAKDWGLLSGEHAGVKMHSLPPFLRTLLVTDGTVTKTLEAFYWESVRITGLAQRVTTAEAAIEWLKVGAGESVLARSVQLQGEDSRRLYANAFSIIRLDVIPPLLRQQLLDGTIGIGELIRGCGLESYRELMEIGMTDDFSLGGEFSGEFANDAAARQTSVFRTYRISVGGMPAVLVTECFPIRLFAG